MLHRLLVFTLLALLMSSCTHFQKLGTERQIGPLKSGNAYLLRTGPKETRTYAQALKDVSSTSATLSADSTFHVFTFADAATFTLYHGTPIQRNESPGARKYVMTPFAGGRARWEIARRPTGYRAEAFVVDGGQSWNLVVSADTEGRVYDLLGQVSTFRVSRRPWPDLVLTPNGPNVDARLLRGHGGPAHCR